MRVRLDSPASRAMLLAVLVALPVVGSAAFFLHYLVNRLIAVDVHPAPSPSALVDLVSGRDVLRAFVMVDAGVDTSDPQPFTDDVLTNDVEVWITPLMLAAARNDDNMVRMLLTYAAAPEARERWMASCLAASRGNAELASLIAAALPGDRPCPAGIDTPGLLQAFSAQLTP